MAHADSFWADKLSTIDQKAAFWFWVNVWKFSGESSFNKVMWGQFS
jgi:hypothetical protein